MTVDAAIYADLAELAAVRQLAFPTSGFDLQCNKATLPYSCRFADASVQKLCQTERLTYMLTHGVEQPSAEAWQELTEAPGCRVTEDCYPYGWPVGFSDGRKCMTHFGLNRCLPRPEFSPLRSWFEKAETASEHLSSPFPDSWENTRIKERQLSAALIQLGPTVLQDKGCNPPPSEYPVSDVLFGWLSDLVSVAPIRNNQIFEVSNMLETPITIWVGRDEPYGDQPYDKRWATLDPGEVVHFNAVGGAWLYVPEMEIGERCDVQDDPYWGSWIDGPPAEHWGMGYLYADRNLPYLWDPYIRFKPDNYDKPIEVARIYRVPVGEPSSAADQDKALVITSWGPLSDGFKSDYSTIMLGAYPDLFNVGIHTGDGGAECGDFLCLFQEVLVETINLFPKVGGNNLGWNAVDLFKLFGMADSDLKLGNLVEALAESVAGELEGSTSKDDIAEALKFEPDKAWYCPKD